MTRATSTADSKASALIDLLPVGALVVDDRLRVLAWNYTLSEWSGKPTSTMVGRYLPEAFPNIRENAYRERLDQVFSRGFPANYSAALHRHFLPIPARHGLHGQLMIQETHVRRLPEYTDRALIIIQDVSLQYLQLEQLKCEQRKLAQANSDLLERNRELDDFTYLVSHDLKEPLRTVSMFAAVLSEHSGHNFDSTGKESLRFLQGAANRMTRLVDDLLVLTRAGRDEISHEKIDLTVLVADVLGLLEQAIDKSGAEVKVHKLPCVVGDYRLLHQLYQNLIENAIKFVGEESPRIELTAEKRESEWVFGVRDNGIGIAAPDAQRIFKPFQRIYSPEEYEGAGIGLSICYKAVVRHGGSIWVESTPRNGAHFLFTLGAPSDPGLTRSDAEAPIHQRSIATSPTQVNDAREP